MGNIGIPSIWPHGQQSRLASASGEGQYWRKIVSVRPGSLYAYWPMWEPSGTDVQDYSGNGDRATSTGLGVRNPGPDGVHQASAFNATPSHVNLLSAEFASRFNGAEGTCLLWGQAASAGQWTDGIIRFLFRLMVDGSNYLDIYKNSVNNNLILNLVSGGFSNGANWNDIDPGVAWFVLGMTWSKTANEVKGYYQGEQKGATTALTGVWAGAPVEVLLGAYTTAALFPWLGYLAHVAFWNAPLSASEIKHLSEV